jgi:DNA-3-methyladenine glycosylase II
MPLEAPPTVSRSQHKCFVATPYRLDLTVSALRRLSTNLVDVLTPDGQYARALGGARQPVIARVTQASPKILTITIAGDKREHGRGLALVRRMLGVDCDLRHFHRAAARIPWLKQLAARMHGVRPPRYPTLWEACVNAIVFQQISLQAASAIVRRLVMALGQPVETEGDPLYAFPTAASLQGSTERTLRAAGLSLAKLTTLRRVGDALASGALDEAALAERTSADAAAALRRIKGIGPWTAAVILLRGLGRLDVFPADDTSVARNLALVSGSAPMEMGRALRALSPQQGMLYYVLLLARLEARGDLGRASVTTTGATSAEGEFQRPREEAP